MSGSRGLDFKSKLDTLYKDIQATGEAFGRAYDQKVCELIPEFFDVEDLFDDEYLQNFFEEKVEEGEGYYEIAHNYTQEQIQNGVLPLSDLLDLEDDDVKAQVFALVQANFTKEEVFPEDKPIGISDSVSDAVGRQVEVLEAQNQALRLENQKLQQYLQDAGHAIKSLQEAQDQALRLENQKLQQQLNAIKSLLHAN
ncbi:hypothetical protein [Dishui lake virophage 1]|nr:hypothetical protein [Dishui lake virophage 1]